MTISDQNKTESYQYIADNSAGSQEAHRLALKHDVFGPDTVTFLQQIIKPDMKVLVPGCGTGEELIEIAKLVGPNGSVIGIDMNHKQLEQAQIKLNQANIKNATLLQHDIHDATNLGGDFDLVFTRFVLAHMDDPIHVLQTLKQCLKSGGHMACEESEVAAAYCTPNNENFSKHIQLLLNYAKTAGHDFNIGTKLETFFSQLGLHDLNSYVTQPIMTTAKYKAIVPLSSLSAKPAYIKHRLADEKEIDELIEKLWQEVVNSETIVGQIKVHHIVGTK